MKYLKNDIIYYQNNPALFVSYLTSYIAVIIVELLPNFDDTTTIGSCQGCLVGDSDNKLSCTCDETEYVLELLQENTDPTKMPLIVNVNMLFDKPMVILKHEDELAKINEKRQLVINETSELILQKRVLKKAVEALGSTLKELEQRKSDYTQLEDEMGLGEFTQRIGAQMAHMLYTENDSRKCVGGSDSRVFTFRGNNYEIKVNAFWDRSDHFDYEVKGLSVEYEKKDSAISF